MCYQSLDENSAELWHPSKRAVDLSYAHYRIPQICVNTRYRDDHEARMVQRLELRATNCYMWGNSKGCDRAARKGEQARCSSAKWALCWSPGPSHRREDHGGALQQGQTLDYDPHGETEHAPVYEPHQEPADGTRYGHTSTPRCAISKAKDLTR